MDPPPGWRGDHGCVGGHAIGRGLFVRDGGPRCAEKRLWRNSSAAVTTGRCHAGIGDSALTDAAFKRVDTTAFAEAVTRGSAPGRDTPGSLRYIFQMVFRKRVVRPSRPDALAVLALLLVPWVFSGCADARSSGARGPDDRDSWLEVTCRQQQRNCYDEAARRCPTGYEVAQNQGRYDAGTDVPLYSGYMLVRCTAPANVPG